MATPLREKLRIRSGMRIALLHAPRGYAALLEPLPKNTVSRRSIQGTFDLIQAFYRKRSELARELPSLRDALNENGILWLSYPKGTSGEVTDLKREVLMDVAMPRGLRGVAAIAIDDVWTAIRFKRAPDP